MYQHIKERIWALVEDRNFTFMDTSRADAEAYLDKFRVFEGLSEEEVVVIETELSYRFPEEFREYLKVFGKKCSWLFEGGADLNAFKIPSYQSLRSIVEREEGTADFFKEDTIVFYHHQGYIFCCFHRDENEEVKIYFYHESQGTKPPYKIYDNFLEMVELEMKVVEKKHEEMKQMGGYFVKLAEGEGEQHTIPLDGTLTPREVDDFFLD